MSINKCKQQGSALLSALFIMTLVAIAATAMTTRLQLDIYRTRLTIDSDKLYLASQAVTFWAMAELTDKKNKFTKADKKNKLLDYPSKLATIYPGVKVTGGLYDLQARFNLNNLFDRKYQPYFYRLLNTLPTQLTPEQRVTIIVDIRSWISPYTPGREGEPFVKYYLEQKPPYYPGQQRMKNGSELRLIKGVDAATYQALMSYAVALPEPTPINLNTASKEVLRPLGNGLTENQVNQLIETRKEEGATLKDYNKLIQKFDIRAEQVTVESDYFLVIASASNNDLRLMRYTVIKRNKDQLGNFSVSIISESLNSFD